MGAMWRGLMVGDRLQIRTIAFSKYRHCFRYALLVRSPDLFIYFEAIWYSKKKIVNSLEAITKKNRNIWALELEQRAFLNMQVWAAVRIAKSCTRTGK